MRLNGIGQDEFFQHQTQVYPKWRRISASIRWHFSSLPSHLVLCVWCQATLPGWLLSKGCSK